jgi:hypothetical protein
MLSSTVFAGIVGLGVASAAVAVAAPSIQVLVAQGEQPNPRPDRKLEAAARCGDTWVFAVEGELFGWQPEHARTLWSQPLPAGEVRLLSRGDRVVVAAADAVRSQSALSGAVEWQHPLAGQRLLHFSHAGAVLAGFLPALSAVQELDLQTGAPRWPTWAEVPSPTAAELAATEIRVVSAANAQQTWLVDRATGRTTPRAGLRVGAPEPPKHDAAREVLCIPSRACGRWAGEPPALLEPSGEGQWLAVLPGRVVLLAAQSPAQWGQDCASAAERGDTSCLAHGQALLPYVPELRNELLAGVGALTARVRANHLASVDTSVAVLMASRASGAAFDTALTPLAKALASAALDRVSEADFDRALAIVDALATVGAPLRTRPLRFAVALEKARDVWRQARVEQDLGAWRRSSELLESLVALDPITPLLPSELADAGEGARQNEAALGALHRALFTDLGGETRNPPLCLARCDVERELCAGAPPCEATWQQCLAQCAPQ